MNIIIKEVSKDLYINRTHYDNPFAQYAPEFYVRILEIKDGWVVYLTCTNRVKFKKFEEFFSIFCRPEKVDGNVCRSFSFATVSELKGMKDIILDNPWHFGRSCEDYKPTKYLGNFKY